MEWAVLALDSHLVDARASSHSGFGVASALWCPKTLHKAPLTLDTLSRDGQTTTKTVLGGPVPHCRDCQRCRDHPQLPSVDPGPANANEPPREGRPQSQPAAPIAKGNSSTAYAQTVMSSDTPFKFNEPHREACYPPGVTRRSLSCDTTPLRTQSRCSAAALTGP